MDLREELKNIIDEITDQDDLGYIYELIRGVFSAPQEDSPSD